MLILTWTTSYLNLTEVNTIPDNLRIGIVCAHLIPSLGWREHYLANGLSALGHEVTVFTSDRKPWRHFYGDKSRVTDDSAEQNYKIRRIFTPFEIGESPLMSPRMPFEIASADLDILDIHEFYHIYSITSSLACYLRGKPFIVSSERLGSNVNRSRNTLYKIASKPGLILAKKAKQIVAASTGVQHYLEHIGVPPQKITTISNGVDTGMFRFSESDLREQLGLKDDPVVGYFGALRPGKGIEDLVKSMVFVKRECHNARLLCVGDGPLKPHLQNLCRELRLNDTVFSGFVPHDKLPPLYSAVDVVACPVSHAHASGPFVVLEAMACSKPVVGTPLQQIPEFIADKENGFITPPGDTQLLSQSLLLILRNSELRAKMGQASRMRAEKFFDWRVTCRQFEDVYSSALSDVKDA